MADGANASKWRMGFNSAFKGLIYCWLSFNVVPSTQQQCVKLCKKLACSLSVGILFQMKQLFLLLSLIAKMPMAMRLKWLLAIINVNQRCRRGYASVACEQNTTQDDQKQSCKGISTAWASDTSHTVRISQKAGLGCGGKTQNNDDACGSCTGLYSEDTKTKNGAEWMECSFFRVYHTACQKKVVEELHFVCDGCEYSDDSK